MEGQAGSEGIWTAIGSAILTTGILIGLGGRKVLKKLFGNGGNGTDNKLKSEQEGQSVTKEYAHSHFLSKEESKKNWDFHDKFCVAQLRPIQDSVNRVETKLDKLLAHSQIKGD